MTTKDVALDAMRYLLSQVSGRPLLYGLVKEDINRWDDLTLAEKRLAFARAVRRVGSVCPWVKTKGQIDDARQHLETEEA